MLSRENLRLAVIPLLILFVSLWASSMRGPYYAGINSDPEYCYLMNALNLLTLQAPAHIDHPGTTLQLLLAVVFVLRHAAACTVGSCASIQADILSDPEAYLRLGNFVLLSGIAAGIFFVGLYIRRRVSSLPVALVAQGAAMLFPIVLQSLGRVSPEPLVFILSLLYGLPFLSILIARVQGRNASENDIMRCATAAGLLMGAGIVSKLTFAPLGIMVLALPGLKPKLRYLLCALLSTTVFILPAASRLESIYSWSRGLLTHSGIYGSGAEGLPSQDTLSASFDTLWKAEPYYLVWLVAAIAAAAFFRSIRREVLCASAGALLVFAITVKHPGVRYLIPGIGLLSFSISAIALAMPRTKLSIGVMGLMLTASGWHFVKETSEWAFRQRDYVASAAKLTLARHEAGIDCKSYHYYGSSDLIASLGFGNDYSGWKYSDVLRALYPGKMRYNTFRGGFDQMDNVDRTNEVVADVQAGKCILIQGSMLIEKNWPTAFGLGRTVLAQTSAETLSRLTYVPSAAVFAAAPSAAAVILEAEKTKAGNAVVDSTAFGAEFGVLTTPRFPAWVELDVSVPAAGKYEIRARYASADSRPLKLSIAGKLVSREFCKAATGGYYPPNQKWVSGGSLELPSGTFTLRMESDGPFPHLDKLAFIPEPGAAK